MAGCQRAPSGLHSVPHSMPPRLNAGRLLPCPQVSRGRIAGNDRPNAELIAGTKARATRVVPSLPFAGPPPSDSESSD